MLDFFAGKKTILVIDYDPTPRRMLGLRLGEVDGFRVLEAADGAAGFTLAEEAEPDLILLDWKMPGCSGIKILRRLKKDVRTRDIPAYMLTAKSKVGEIDDAFRSGADGYIVKPFDLAGVSRDVRAVLER